MPAHYIGHDQSESQDHRTVGRSRRFTVRLTDDEYRELIAARRLNDLRGMSDHGYLAWDAPQLSGLLRWWSLQAARAALKGATAAELRRIQKETRTL